MTVRSRRVALGFAGLIALAACNSGEVEQDDVTVDAGPENVPAISVTVPPERLTPFCAGMIDLRDRLETDPPADVGAAIVEAYTALLDVVPPELEQDFKTVLARLQASEAVPATAATTVAVTPDPADPSVPTSTTPYADEGYAPDDDPALRINEYVQFACADSINNPGPAATQPGETAAP